VPARIEEHVNLLGAVTALGREPVPDETTVCRFRHLLEAHDLGQQLFDEVQRHLAAKGLKVATGTIVDATIISAPSSTKNAEKARDPEMHQTSGSPRWCRRLRSVGLDWQRRCFGCNPG
jgi:IS5 family transposase